MLKFLFVCPHINILLVHWPMYPICVLWPNLPRTPLVLLPYLTGDSSSLIYTQPCIHFMCSSTYLLRHSSPFPPLTSPIFFAAVLFWRCKPFHFTFPSVLKRHVTWAIQNGWVDWTVKHYSGSIKQFIRFCNTMEWRVFQITWGSQQTSLSSAPLLHLVLVSIPGALLGIVYRLSEHGMSPITWNGMAVLVFVTPQRRP